MRMRTPAPKQNEALATSWPLGCLTAMVKWSRLASHSPAQKVKPDGEASEFPVLENKEGNQAIYWNPPPFPGPSPQPFLESLQCAGCSPGGWGCRESLLPLERDSVPLLARQDMTRLPKPGRSSPKGCQDNLLHPRWLSPSCGLPSQHPSCDSAHRHHPNPSRTPEPTPSSQLFPGSLWNRASKNQGKPIPTPAWVADGETEAQLVSGKTLSHCAELSARQLWNLLPNKPGWK